MKINTENNNYIPFRAKTADWSSWTDSEKVFPSPTKRINSAGKKTTQAGVKTLFSKLRFQILPFHFFHQSFPIWYIKMCIKIQWQKQNLPFTSYLHKKQVNILLTQWISPHTMQYICLGHSNTPNSSDIRTHTNTKFLLKLLFRITVFSKALGDTPSLTANTNTFKLYIQTWLTCFCCLN